MQSFLDKIEKLKIGWNHVELNEDLFLKLCERLNVRVKYMPLTVQGFYNCNRRKHYIAVNERLRGDRRAFVMFHEFGHYLMHSPRTDTVSNYCGSKENSRDEQEADAFAYCALLPLSLLKTRDSMELADIYGSTFFMERLAVYERYGI